MWVLRALLGFGSSLIGRSGLNETLKGVAKDLIGAYSDLEKAQSEVEKAKIRERIARLKAIHDLQSQVASRRFSPVVIGQFLIVIPFGVWWASIYGVSVANGIFGWDFKVLDVPAHITEMAWWLIPAIVVGTVVDRRMR